MELLQGLDVFASVAAEGTFTAAAKQCGVSVAHVSRQVRALEERLGVVLCQRTTRKIVLTESGRFYADQVQAIRRQLIVANERIQGEQDQLIGPISVSCAVGFASRRITTCLARFAKQHPKVELSVDYSSRNVDLLAEGFDLAIRFGKLADSNLMARRLSQRPLILSASPDYVREAGRPCHPDELAEHNCLIASNRRWQFELEGKRFAVNIGGNWQSNNADALITACLAGLGISYLAYDLVENHLEDGNLVSLLPDYCITDNASWLLYPRMDFQPRRHRALIDYLVATNGGSSQPFRERG